MIEKMFPLFHKSLFLATLLTGVRCKRGKHTGAYLPFNHKGRFKKVKGLIHTPQQLLYLEQLIADLSETGHWERVNN